MPLRCLLVVLGWSLAAGAWANTGSLAVSAVVISRSVCTIFSPASMDLPFGSIDPASRVDATVSVQMTIGCFGSNATTTFALTANDGLHPQGAGNRRMLHGTVSTAFLPYSITINPASATVPRLALRTITITGTITPAQFQDARVGAYSDTVAVTVNP
jgi:spore coat protein U-like protein